MKRRRTPPPHELSVHDIIFSRTAPAWPNDCPNFCGVRMAFRFDPETRRECPNCGTAIFWDARLGEFLTVVPESITALQSLPR